MRLLLAFRLLVILLLPLQPCMAQQPKSVKRIEISAGKEDVVIPLDKNGVLVLTRMLPSERSETVDWEFYKYNTDLDRLWRKRHSFTGDATLQDSERQGDWLYLLFGESDNYQVLKINILNGAIEATETQVAEPMQVSEFMVFDDKALLAGATAPRPKDKKEPQALAYILDLKSALLKPLPLSYQGTSRVMDVYEDTVSHKLLLLTYNEVKKKEASRLYITELDQNLAFLNSYEVASAHPSNELMTGQISSTKEGNRVVVGIFKDVKAQEGTVAGMYITGLDNSKQKFIRYHNFASFKNFFNVLSKAGQDKIQEKSKAMAGKEHELSYHIGMLLHSPLAYKNSYLMLAETFLPERTEHGLIAYRYMHAIVAAFGEDGEILWDNSMEIRNVLAERLQGRVRGVVRENNMLLAYCWKGSVYSKEIHEGQLGEGKTVTEVIKPNEAGHRAGRIYDEDMYYWFETTFLAHGHQELTGQDGKTRKIFYVQKVVYEN